MVKVLSRDGTGGRVINPPNRTGGGGGNGRHSYTIRFHFRLASHEKNIEAQAKHMAKMLTVFEEMMLLGGADYADFTQTSIYEMDPVRLIGLVDYLDEGRLPECIEIDEKYANMDQEDLARQLAYVVATTFRYSAGLARAAILDEAPDPEKGIDQFMADTKLVSDNNGYTVEMTFLSGEKLEKETVARIFAESSSVLFLDYVPMFDFQLDRAIHGHDAMGGEHEGSIHFDTNWILNPR